MRLTRLMWIAVVALPVLALTLPDRAEPLQRGAAQFESIGSLVFGLDNVLFAGDSDAAAVFALDVDDRAAAAGQSLNVSDLDAKIAALLGTGAEAITVQDLAVHPVSQRAYLSVTRGSGDAATPVLLRITAEGDIEEVDLTDIRFSKASITNAPASDAMDRRGRSLRTNSITDLSFADGQLYVAGLSNEEFASHLRRLPYPFSDNMTSSSLEIYHVSHGQYETNAPVRTFMPYSISGESHILAAYTCTPLVAFSVTDLDDGAHVSGRTVAELGNRNTPLDMVSYEHDGSSHLLIANSSRGVMKLDGAALPNAETLTEPDEGTAGVNYATLSWTGVEQLAMLNDENVLVLQRSGEGAPLELKTYPVSQL